MSRPPAERAEVGLLDTSALVALGDLDPARLPRRPSISTVTLAELSVGPLVAQSDSTRIARLRTLQLAEADFDPLPFDVAAARAFGEVAASLRSAGRKARSRTFDAMIAAVALANGLALYTCNPRDFKGIGGLELAAVSPPAS